MCSADLAKAIDSAVFPGLQGGPLEHVIAAKAVAFAEAARPEFRTYAAQVVTNAAALGEALVATGIRLVSGGTENHQLLVDLRTFDEELTGKVAQEVLDRAGITCNRNTIPDEPRSPFVTSGLRLGSAAQTTAGMGPAEMQVVGALIGRTLRNRDDEAVIKQVRGEVHEPCAAFPPYPDAVRDVSPGSGATGELGSTAQLVRRPVGGGRGVLVGPDLPGPPPGGRDRVRRPARRAQGPPAGHPPGGRRGPVRRPAGDLGGGRLIPALRPLFQGSSDWEPLGLILGAAAIFVVGADRRPA